MYRARLRPSWAPAPSSRPPPLMGVLSFLPVLGPHPFLCSLHPSPCGAPPSVCCVLCVPWGVGLPPIPSLESPQATGTIIARSLTYSLAHSFLRACSPDTSSDPLVLSHVSLTILPWAVPAA